VPGGMDEESAADADEAGWSEAVLEHLGELEYKAHGANGREVRLWRRATRIVEFERASGKVRERQQWLREAVDLLEEDLAAAVGTTDIERRPLRQYEGDEDEPDQPVLGFQNQCLTWTAGGAGAPVEHHLVAFRGKEWTYALDYRSPPGEESDAVFRDVCASLRFAMESGEYDRRFGLYAPLKFNILFSIASSVAFAALMLLIGWWRLSRIDF